MGWFRKKRPQEEVSASPRFETVYFTEQNLANVATSIRQLAGENDESVLKEAIAQLDPPDQMALAGALAVPPITSTKVATLSVLMFSPLVVDVASFALWQQLLSQAEPDQLRLLRECESGTSTAANYDSAYALLSGLMTAALGRDLKVGEMENVRSLVSRFLRLSPDKLYS